MQTRVTILKMIKAATIAVTISIICPAGPCPAGQKGVPLPAHYPEEFSSMGCIDRMDSDFIVIDDMETPYARKAKFYIRASPDPVSLRHFREGRQVGLILNARRQIESMWYLGRCRY